MGILPAAVVLDTKWVLLLLYSCVVTGSNDALANIRFV